MYSPKEVEFNTPHAHEFLNNPHITKLSDDDRNMCEGELSYDECYKVLCKMKIGKSPGNDGLSVIFYKTFWADFGVYLVNCLNANYRIGELSNSQKQGVITLILKQGKDKRRVENYRPITLLNVDLKIGSRAVAERIAMVTPKLIGPYQSAFVEARYIGDSVRTVADVLYFTKDKNIPGILLCIDFEKAYDSIDHKFLHEVMKAFNFGTSIQKWVKTFYTDITSCVMNNGMSTGYFPIQRGLRQGDALSCQLFNLCLEILCIQLYNRDDIKGIQVGPDTQVKLSCYADDMCLFLNGVNDVACVLQVLRDFQSISSLKVNYHKTEAMWLGCMRNSITKPGDVQWTNSVKVLGIHFTYDDTEMINLNYNEKLKSLEKCLNMWRMRDLTVMGKIVIVKTFGLSKFLYTSSMIGMPNRIQNKVNEIIYQFIWNGPDKIKRSVSCRKFNEGGLNMCDLKSRIKTQSVMWLKRLVMPNEAGWKYILLSYLNKFGGRNILNCNFDPKILFGSIPPFYLQCFSLWSELNANNPSNAREVCRQVIWNNRFILIGNRSVYYAKFEEAGFHTIYDFFDVNGEIKKPDLLGRYKFSGIDIIRWYGLIDAIPKQWRDMIHNEGIFGPSSIDVGVTLVNGTTPTPLIKLRSRDVYSRFIDDIKKEPVSQSSLKRLYNLSDSDCSDIFILPFKTTLNSKLRWFQYRIIHNILPTNAWLFKINLKDVDVCTFCHKEKETITHIFANCEVVNVLWQTVKEYFDVIPDLTPFIKLYGFIDADLEDSLIINQIILTVKYYVYKCKWEESRLSFNVVKHLIADIEKLENYCAKRNSKEEFHVKKWSPILHLI